MSHLPILLKKVYIEPVPGACNRRRLDAQKIASFFDVNGYSIVKHPKNADIILLVTCAVSLEREDKSIDRICSLKKYHGELIVCGCLPAINEHRLSSIFNGISISTLEVNKIDNYFPNMRVKFIELGDANCYFRLHDKLFSYGAIQIIRDQLKSFRMLSLRYICKKEIPRLVSSLIKKSTIKTFSFPIRVSWGCVSKCSYCGVRVAVGKHHSKPLETCRNEFMEGLNNGYKEFEIIADDVGAYGIDIGKTFPDLLNLLFELHGEYSVLIWNMSPICAVKYQDDFISILQKNKISKIHIPVQSGSSKILKSMNRYSDAHRIRKAISLFKEACPNLAMSTDIIVGYPGENEDDIDKTIELIRSVHFNSVGIFMYYDAPNTTASYLKDKIPRSIVEQRVCKVRGALEKMDIEYGVS